MSLVLDASLALAAVFEDEASDVALDILRQVAREGAWVPSLWHLEVANGLLIGVKRGRNTMAFVDQSLLQLGALPIEIDDGTATLAWGATLELARAEGLTLYDAAYLELAIRRSMPLASCDKALKQAAQRNHVELIVI